MINTIRNNQRTQFSIKSPALICVACPFNICTQCLHFMNEVVRRCANGRPIVALMVTKSHHTSFIAHASMGISRWNGTTSDHKLKESCLPTARDPNMFLQTNLVTKSHGRYPRYHPLPWNLTDLIVITTTTITIHIYIVETKTKSHLNLLCRRVSVHPENQKVTEFHRMGARMEVKGLAS